MPAPWSPGLSTPAGRVAPLSPGPCRIVTSGPVSARLVDVGVRLLRQSRQGLLRLWTDRDRQRPGWNVLAPSPRRAFDRGGETAGPRSSAAFLTSPP